MRRRLFTALLPLLMLSSGVCAHASDDKFTTLHIEVVRDFNGKPVRNAAVILHFVTKNGHQSKRGMEIKTDGEGKTSYPAVPFGKIRIQVISPGLQTFGEDYELNQPEQQVNIRLKRPQAQYSAYDESNAKPAPRPSGPAPGADSQTPTAATSPAAKPASSNAKPDSSSSHSTSTDTPKL